MTHALSHITVTKQKSINGKKQYDADNNPIMETKTRYHTICEMAEAEEALTPESFKAFAKWQASQKQAEADRKAFEACMIENDLDDAKVDVEGIGKDLPLVPDSCEAVFGYNFGRIAVAAIKSTERKGKAKSAKTALKLKAKAAPVAEEPKAETAIPDMPATLIRKGKKV